MAKKPKKPPAGKWEKIAAGAAESPFDDLLEAITDDAKTHYPGQVFTGGEAAQRVMCLRVPALSVRYLLQQEGYPLERFTQIVGPRASGKSSLGYEIIYWHAVAMG